MNWFEIIGWALAVIFGIFGATLLVRYRQAVTFIHAIGELVDVAAHAIELLPDEVSPNITPKELATIRGSYSAVILAFKALLGQI